MKYKIKSGDLQTIVEADNLEDAFRLAIENYCGMLGLIFEHTAENDEPRYSSTEQVLRKLDLWEKEEINIRFGR